MQCKKMLWVTGSMLGQEIFLMDCEKLKLIFHIYYLVLL